MQRKLNLLEFTHQRDWGGTDKSSQISIEHYDRSKFNVFAASYVGGPRAQWLSDNKIPHIITQNNEEMINWIKTQNIDVVHFYRGGWTEHRDIAIFKMAGIPVLIERNCFADFDASSDRDLIDKHSFCSKASQGIYQKRSGAFYDPAKVIQQYVPTDIESLACLDRDFSQPIFGRISRKDPAKWHPISIKSLPIIRAAVPNAKFHVVGLPDDYRQLVAENDVQDMIVEFPMLNDSELRNFLNGITVFAHSSMIGESFGNVLAEAMAADLPVVTHHGWDSAQAELITDQYNGYVVDPDDTQAYADRVIQLLKNPAEKALMGSRGQQRAEDWFSIPTVVKQFEDLFIEQAKIKGII